MLLPQRRKLIRLGACWRLQACHSSCKRMASLMWLLLARNRSPQVGSFKTRDYEFEVLDMLCPKSFTALNVSGS